MTDLTDEDLTARVLRTGNLIFEGRSGFEDAVPLLLSKGLIFVEHRNYKANNTSAVQITASNYALKIGYPGYRENHSHTLPFGLFVITKELADKWRRLGVYE